MMTNMHKNGMSRTLKSHAVLILTLGLTVTFEGCSRANPITETQQTAPLEKLLLHENYTMLHLDPGWVITVSSTSPTSGGAKSEIHAYQFGNVQWKQVFTKIIPETYNARGEIRRDMSYRGHPIAVVRIQHGAEAETLQVYGLSGGTLKLVQTLDAGAFEWNYDTGRFNGKVALSAIPSGMADPAVTYIWDGGKFEVVFPKKSK